MFSLRILRHATLVLGLALVARLPAQSLLNYYSFDSNRLSTSGSFITAAGGTGGVLTAMGTGPTVNASGRFGGAADFSGGGALDTAIFAGGSNLGNNFSISFWLKTSDVTALSNSYVLQIGQNSGGIQNAILFGYAAGKVELYGASAVNGDDPRPLSGLTLDSGLNNTWFNVVYTYDSLTLRGYLNGVEVLSTPMSSSFFAAGGLSVGAARNGAAFVTGSLDDVAIWNGVLSPTQVTALQTSPVMPSAIPEPSTYAALAGAAALGLAVWRRRGAKTA